MEPVEILRKLFKEEELNKYLINMLERLQKALKKKNYKMAALYSIDAAHTYELLDDKKNATYYFRVALEYLDRAGSDYQWARTECLEGLGKYEEALQIFFDSGNPPFVGLGCRLEKAGRHEEARKLYAEFAAKKSCDPERLEHLYPQCLQHISDLWERAQDMEKSREYNQKALEEWERMENNPQSKLYPIEEAWLYEGVGYIYEKAGMLGKAMEYYRKSEEKYGQANQEEYEASTTTHIRDGDWDFFYIEYFYVQVPEIEIAGLRYEHPMKPQLRRIRYRILLLEEKMKEHLLE